MTNVVVAFLAKTKKASREIEQVTAKIKQLQETVKRGRSSGGGSLPLPTFASAGTQRMMEQVSAAMPVGHFGANIDRMLSSGDPKQLAKATRQIEKSLSSTFSGKELQYATSSYINKVREMARETAGASSGLLKFKSVIGLVILALGTFITKIVKFGIQAEDTVASMEVLFRSQERAIQQYQEALDYSIRTPFTPVQVAHATQTAAQFGMTNIFERGAHGLGQDQNVADILAGMGSFTTLGPGGHRGQKLGMERAAQAVFRGDYRLLRPFRGIASGAYRTAQQAGMAGTPEFTKVFIRELGKIPEIMNMAERASRTVSGLWSTITGAVEVFFTYLSGAGESGGIETFWTHFRGIVKDIRDWMVQWVTEAKASLIDIGAYLGRMLTGVWNFIKIIFKIIQGIGNIVGPILVPALKIMFNVVSFIFEAVGMILSTFVDLVSVVGGFILKITGLAKALKAIALWLQDAVLTTKIFIMFSKIELEGLLRDMPSMFEKFIDRAWKKITTFFEYLERLYNKHRRIFNALLSLGTSEIGESLSSAWQGIPEAVRNPVSSGVNWLRSGASNLSTQAFQGIGSGVSFAARGYYNMATGQSEAQAALPSIDEQGVRNLTNNVTNSISNFFYAPTAQEMRNGLSNTGLPGENHANPAAGLPGFIGQWAR